MPFWRTLRRSPSLRAALGFEETLWSRKVSDDSTRRLVRSLDPVPRSALEISGWAWSEFGFPSYTSVEFPAFDICKDVLPGRFDLVIAEHVFEHVRSPLRAAMNVREMLKPNGRLLVVTPFLYKVHPNPLDTGRWTEAGLRYLLEDAGYPAAGIVTGSWGNRACIEATFRREYRVYNRYLHSTVNDPDYPV